MSDDQPEPRPRDPSLRNYKPSELRIASEFLSTWAPFLSRDLCQHCTQTLSDRIRSLDLELDSHAEQEQSEENSNIENSNSPGMSEDHDDNCDNNSIGSWKDGWNGGSEPVVGPSTSSSPRLETPPSQQKKSWADMEEEEEEEEDEFEEEEEEEEDDSKTSKRVVDLNAATGELRISKVVVEKPKLPREQREFIRFTNLQRKKDFICLERVKGKFVNILDGLELHTGVFSAVEQKRIVDHVYQLQEMGVKGELKERTYSAPSKWMKGKGRVTLQFGCCYNYAIDKNGNPPGILPDELVDPIPPLFKVIIRRLVRWHVLPPTCVPDSCIVNIYEEGDCIPPHIDNHDFMRPFCTVSFLSECDILFGSNLKIVGAGEFAGPYSIRLPLGSVLVLNGNGADVAKHCVPAVPSKRISITFRRMDESKRPTGFVPEPDLQGIQPLSYEEDKAQKLNAPKPEYHMKKQSVRRAVNMEARGSAERSYTHIEPREPTWSRRGPANRRRVGLNLSS
ncbi:RNA demethylase ALKBH9B [Castanea sativa]|uniref:RNA demethylase ALKBH9B n=1 Tax=Castanea sativa TaxID=21020 RepID=UPI003F653B20